MKSVATAFAALAIAVPAAAQDYSQTQARMAAQRDALAHFKPFHGRWRGKATAYQPTGKLELTQTERVGPFLDGATLLVEGRGYGADGALRFNAFAQIAYDPDTRAYSFRSQAMGYVGVFPVRLIPNGYIWEAPAGPGAIIRYSTTITDGVWREVGERVAAGQPTVRTFEMELRRLGDTDWPQAGTVPAR